MRKKTLLVVMLTCLVGVFFSARWLVERLLTPPVAQPAQADAEHLRIAERFLDALDTGQYEQALSMTAPPVSTQLDNGGAQKMWEGLPVQLGARRSREAFRGERIKDYPIVTATVTYGSTALDARIGINDEGKINAFRLVPHQNAVDDRSP